MDIERVTDILNKSARIVAHQIRAVEKLKAEGADTTEAENLLAYFATAHTAFENFLQEQARGAGSGRGKRRAPDERLSSFRR
jgi:hypothetical protein